VTILVSRDDVAPAEWDAFVRAQPGWTHFHLYGWRPIMERVLRHECVHLAARTDDGALVGVLPLVRVRSRLFGHFLVSMPFLNYGGPLGTRAGIAALAAEAVELRRQSGAKLLELRSRVPLDIPLAASHRKLTVVRDLPSDPEALWRTLDPKLRSQVRRPQKEGVTVRFGGDQLDAFYPVFARHMRDLGTPTQSRRLFEAIVDGFGESIQVGSAWYRGRPIAAGIGIRWGGEIEMTWASALVEYKRLAANMLLYWAFMERAAADGLSTFNFGRCSPGSGTHRFKMQWGGREEPLWWYADSSVPEVATPSPTDSAYAWGPRLWRHLPTSVATAVGPSIVRLIP
jgi:serine/alanine adding enzyme